MDRYSDYKPVGTAKTGPVFQAVDSSDGQGVLVKQIPKDGQGDFPLDGVALKQAATSLTAPRGFPWVEIREIGEDEFSHYVVSRLVSDAPSAAQHPQKGQFSPAEAVDILNQLASALSELERMRLTHGDIKPSNVLIGQQADGRPHVMLTDTGLSAFRKSHPVESLVFMAPERLGGGPATGASDLFTAGHIVYYLLTGYSLVGGNTVAELQEAWRKANPASLKKFRTDLDLRFVKVLLSILETNKAKRPATAGQVVRDLLVLNPPALPQPTVRAVQATAPGTAVPPTQPVRPTQPVAGNQPRPTARVAMPGQQAQPVAVSLPAQPVVVATAALRPPPEVAAQMGIPVNQPRQPVPVQPMAVAMPQPATAVPVAAWTQPMGSPNAPRAMAQPHPQQGYPQQPHPQQGYPQQPHPQQGYPQQLPHGMMQPQMGMPMPAPGYGPPAYAMPGMPMPGYGHGVGPGYRQPKKNLGLIIGLSVLAVLLLGGVTYMLLTLNKAKDEAKKPSESTSPEDLLKSMDKLSTKK